MLLIDLFRGPYLWSIYFHPNDTEEPGRLLSMGSQSQTQQSNKACTHTMVLVLGWYPYV